jgi:hypothetical protein
LAYKSVIHGNLADDAFNRRAQIFILGASQMREFGFSGKMLAAIHVCRFLKQRSDTVIIVKTGGCGKAQEFCISGGFGVHG